MQNWPKSLLFADTSPVPVTYFSAYSLAAFVRARPRYKVQGGTRNPNLIDESERHLGITLH